MSLGGRLSLHHQPLNNEQRFELKCESLSRNDPKITKVDDERVPIGYAQRLGKALLNNTHVTSMQLHNLEKLFGTDTIHAVEKHESEDGKVKTIKESVEPLLGYLRTGPVLRHVAISYTSNPMGESMTRMVDLLLEAILDNPNVEDIRLAFFYFPMQTMLRFFRTLLPAATSLKKLGVQTVGNGPCTLENRLLVSEAVKLNSSLTSIKMICQPELIEAILTGLVDKGGHHQLQELITRGLAFHLQLDGFTFTEEGVKELVHCLIGFYPAESNGDRFIPASFLPVISKLTLCECGFDGDDAKDVWCNFLQTRVEPKVGNASTSSLETSSRPIPELHLNDGDGRKDSSWTSVDLVPLLCTQSSAIDNDVKPSAKGEHPSPATTPVLQPTVGSQIQSLSVSLGHSCFDGLFQGLADNAEQIQIQKLRIPDLGDRNDFAALTQCIAKISSLRELDFDCGFLAWIGKLPDEVVASLKKNGHIQSVTVSSNVESKLIHAYCKRNQCLEQLLLESSAGFVDKSESPAATHKQEDTTPAKRTHSEMQGHDNSVDEESDFSSRSNKKHKLSLCPTLCKSAMQLPTMRSTLLSRTLLRLPESIGNRETE